GGIAAAGAAGIAVEDFGGDRRVAVGGRAGALRIRGALDHLRRRALRAAAAAIGAEAELLALQLAAEVDGVLGRGLDQGEEAGGGGGGPARPAHDLVRQVSVQRRRAAR